MLGKALTTAAAGSAAGGAAGGLGIEDVFSTWLYNGTGSSQTITNGIDLSGEGGLVWTKGRSNASSHWLADTERGVNQILFTDNTNSDTTISSSITAFNSDGFTVGTQSTVNGSGRTLASWTFRKAPGFFDVVTYTGTGASGSPRTVSHNLGSVPGMIVVKKTSGTADDWMVYHRSLGSTKGIKLNRTNAAYTAGDWGNTTPTSSEFYVNANDGAFNESGQTYVAYLFAHDEQIFGESADQSVIKCGSFTTDGSGNATVNLGWEPQWFLMKRTDTSESWTLLDTMRGFTLSNEQILRPNTSSSESNSSGYGYPTATGWSNVGDNSLFYSSADYIYIAIRRGPMKTPTDATDVFTADLGSVSPAPNFTANHVVDLAILHRPGGTYPGWTTRFNEGKYLRSDNTDAEATSGARSFVGQYGFGDGYGTNSDFIAWMFRRAPGFFDVVAYTGTGSATTVSHNLGVAPELMIMKNRSTTGGWYTYAAPLGVNEALQINLDYAALGFGYWNSTAPTASVFSIGAGSNNDSGVTYIAYLFATLDGISKVGSYTGTGSTLNVDCGFSAGARFVLIKRTDSTGDWYVWDTSRGIVSGNDPYLLLNSTAAEVTTTDYIDPYSAGFTVTSSAPAALNASGGSYIFLAIA